MSATAKSWVIQLTPSNPQVKPIYVRSIARTGAITTPHKHKARRFTQTQAHSQPLQQAKDLFERNGFAVAPLEAPAP